MPNSKAKGIAWDTLPLGEVLDSALARQLGCTAAAVYYARKQRGIRARRPATPTCDPNTFAEDLGKMTDREVAERHGVTIAQVAGARRRMGKASSRIDWGLQPLGTVPDIILARRHGVDNKTVAQARWRRGISKWTEQRTCPCGETYTAFHFEQKYCSYRCQRYHWQLVNKKGMTPEVADVAIALWAYKRTMKGRG